MGSDPETVPSYIARHPWLVPALIALILFISSVASNLVAEDLKEIVKPYRGIVWVFFGIAAIITVVTAISDYRRREREHATSPAQRHLGVQHGERWYQSWSKILWISGIVLVIVVGCVIFIYPVVTAPSRISEYVGELHIPRVSHFAMKFHDGKVLIIGGNLRGRRLTNTEIFDPTQSRFLSAGALNIGRSDHGAVLLHDGRVFVAGDNGRPEQGEVYDPTKNMFTLTQRTTVSQHNSSFSMTVLNDGRVLLVGSGQSCCSHKTEIYDPVSDTFHPSFDLLAKRLGTHTATQLSLKDDDSDKVLIAGGSIIGPDKPFAKTSEIMSLKTGSVLSGVLSEARRDHTATLLPSGKVLIVGGLSEEKRTPLSSAEVFDPKLGYFRVVVHMQVPRWGHTATLLPDGSVMVIGGFIERSGSATSIIERYYTVNGSDEFRTVGRLRQARAYHTTTLLDDGTLLVVGGMKHHSNVEETNVLKSAEILHPF